jgi:hypothetical protein
MNWSDPSFLRNVSANIQWLVIAFASIAVCLQTAKHFVDLRERRISSTLAAEKDAEQEAREKALRQQVDATGKRIHALDLALEIDVEAKWKADRDPVGKGLLWTGSKAVVVSFLLLDGTIANAEFGPPQGIGYTRLGPAGVRLSYRATALPGSTVFSIFPEQIAAIQTLDFAGIGISADALEDATIVIVRLNAEFVANGRVRFMATDQSRQGVDVSSAGSNTPRLTLNGRMEVVHPE